MLAFILYLMYAMCDWEHWCDQTPLRDGDNTLLKIPESSAEKRKEYAQMNKIVEKSRRNIVGGIEGENEDSEVNGHRNRDFYIGSGR